MRIVTVVTLLSLLLTAPGAFAVDCNRYWDSQATRDQYGNSWCWLSEAICYRCYDTNTGHNCSENWEACNPYPFHRDQQYAARLDLMNASDGTTSTYCRSSVSTAGRPSARTLL